MSAKKDTQTKITEDSEFDSGIVSGPMDSGILSFDIESSEVKSDINESRNVPIITIDDHKTELDSGLVDVTEELSSFRLDVDTAMPSSVEIKTTNILPPLSVLFKQDDDGDTQLHIAAIHGCERAISTLIKVCPNREWFNVPNDNGHTALHLAVLSRNAVVTRMLVIAGASLAVRDRTGETPVHKATTNKDLDCIRALLNHVKELPHKRHTTVLNQKNYNGQACVHLAAESGHVETLQTLVYYGADINLKENLAGWTALHIAAHRGNAAAVQHLSRCPRVQHRARDFADRTPCRVARKHPHLREAFAAYHQGSDSESDSDDDEYDSDNDTESLFERLQSTLNPRLVV